ncbi:hypothetical protein ACB094_07G141900 [Castanea mollissima]
MSHIPVVLNWEINKSLSSLVMESNSSHSTCQFANGSSLLGNMSTTFTCTCDSGFEGNPYLVDGCQAAVCGSVTIPYPFGIEPGCYINDWFAIDCKYTLGSPKPFLRSFDLEVLDISLEGTLRVNYPMSWQCPKSKTVSIANVSLAPSPFVFSKFRNIFIAMGCGNVAYLLSSDGSNSSLSIIGGCMSVCEKDTIKTNGSSCNGVGCCKTTIPSDIDVFTIRIQSMNELSPFEGTKDCKYAYLVDQKRFDENITNHFEVRKMSHVPVVLNWEINGALSSLVMGSNSSHSHSTCNFANRSSSLGNMISTFTCSCHSSFEGNPNLVDGCQGIRTGIGLLFMFIVGRWSNKVVKKRKYIKCMVNEVTVEKAELFNKKNLEKATDNFNVNRILGQGGQGTVYKGMLTDGKIVAVKKSKVIDEGRLEEFVNESKTEVPLPIYESIPNGTLSQYLYDQKEEFLATWDMRLQIATETTNILLDDKYIAKVADFGTSRSIAIDQTHLTTVVQGTFEYLDPEYFQSNQFTEKSDVYSFGVVLVELLTGEKAISSTRIEESRSLATYFIHSIEENNLFDIIDARVMKDTKQEEIIVVANLAKMCLNLEEKKRPTMKEIVM